MAAVKDEIERAHAIAPDVMAGELRKEDVTYIIVMRPSRDGGFFLNRKATEDRILLFT